MGASGALLAEYDGVAVAALAAQGGLAGLEAYGTITSTLDRAHLLGASGAAAGMAVVAEAQGAGRGRHGRPWDSAREAGVWLTIVERPLDTAAIGVLALRTGLELADALAPFTTEAIRLKWPNDLWTASGKLAGILIEARWRGPMPEWVAVGVGINVRAPAGPDVQRGDAATTPRAMLRAETRRAEVLVAAARAVRLAARGTGDLTALELDRWHARDLARGRELAEPMAGRAVGVRADGALLVKTAGGVQPILSGSLRFAS
ncbi:MAG: biotin--[acetyl-CoA-carboxylase] ligase [Gemmatimonadetes bacterium]|nr:biotin--[acetyl-CoA-carboxylase] ligase [Gemmatimonadota bacterium]